MALHPPEGGWRVVNHPTHGSTAADGANGAFVVPSCEPGWKLLVIASDGGGWEHVSVHAFRDRRTYVQMRTPSWREMAFVKRACWDPEDRAFQIHPAESEYVNRHQHTLHLWSPVDAAMPLPPREMV